VSPESSGPIFFHHCSISTAYVIWFVCKPIFPKTRIPVWRVAGELGHQFAVQGQRYQFSFWSTNSRQRIGMKSPSITDETSAEDLFTQMSVYELRGLERKTRQVATGCSFNPGIESSLAYLHC
jgi:hypothetical protein